MKVTKSKFNTSHTVVYIEETDEKYPALKRHFKKHGLAFKQGNFIFFDMPTIRKNNYDDKTHMTFIEAHEIAHTVLNHTQSSKQIEAEADFLAVLLCKDMNYNKSSKLGQSYFHERNGISFEKFQKKYGNDIYSRISM